MSATPCLVRPTFVHEDGPCECFFGGPGPTFLRQENKEPLRAPRKQPESKGPKKSRRNDPKFRIRIR